MTRVKETTVRWLPWGDRLVAVLAIGMVISLAAAWIMQYADVEGNPGLVERISYTVVDPTGMPPGVTRPYPLIGLHYFGDMWYHIGFGEALTPYIISGRPAQYPPIAIYVFKAWGIFGYPAALAIMTALNIALLSAFAWRAIGAAVPSRKVIIIIFTVLVTTPMIVTLDRGGHQYIAVGILAWSLWNYHRGRTWWAVILMVLAISLKSYLAFFLIYPLVRGHVKFVVRTVVVFVVVNGLLFFSFPGKATVSFGGFFTSTRQLTTSVGFDNIFNGSSLTSLIFHIMQLTEGTMAAEEAFFTFERYLSVPGLLWVGLVAFVAFSRRIPHWASLTLALSTAAMAIPAAWPYNFASMSLAAIYFGVRGQDPFPICRRTQADGASPPSTTVMASSRKHEVALRIIVMTVLCCTLIPQFGQLTNATGAQIVTYSLLAPLSVLLGGISLVIAALLVSIRKSTCS